MPTRSSSRISRALTWSLAFALTYPGLARAREPAARSIAPLILDDAFLASCVDADTRFVEIQIEKATGQAGRALATRLERELEASRAALRAEVVSTRLDGEMLSCDGSGVDAMGDIAANHVIFKIEPFLGEDAVLVSASVLVRSRRGCRSFAVDASRTIGRCNFPRVPVPRDAPPARVSKPSPPPSPPPPPPPPRETQDRRRTIFLATASALTGSTAFTVRLVQATRSDRPSEASVDAMGTSLSAATIVLSGISGAHYAHVDSRQGRLPDRRTVLWLGIAGGTLITGGLIGIGASRYERNWDGSYDPIFAIPLFMSEMTVAGGAGMVTRALARRFTVSPNLAGLTLSGRF